MAIEPAAISARPAVTTRVDAWGLEAMAPEIPAASANGTVSPSDIPMTTSLTDSGAVKWCSVCGVAGIFGVSGEQTWFDDRCTRENSRDGKV
jgi:hypothetical protein